MSTIALVQVAAVSAFDEGAPAIGTNLDQVTDLVGRFSRTAHADLIVLPKGALQGRPSAGCDTTAMAAGALDPDAVEFAALGKLAETIESTLVLGAYLSREGVRAVPSGVVLTPDGTVSIGSQLSRDALDGVHGSSDALDGPHERGRALFSVVASGAGRVGCVVGPDIDAFEVPKASVYAGAEVLAHPSYAPADWLAEARQQALRARGYESVCIVASCELADPYSVGPCTSAVIDWNGRVLAAACQRTAGYVSARVDLARLRERRRRGSMNFPVQTRTHFFGEAMVWAGNRMPVPAAKG